MRAATSRRSRSSPSSTSGARNTPRVIARRIVVSGRVQGVFFRDSMRSSAETRGVSGWVRNCRDGTVEAHLEGEEEAVESVVRWARGGPRRAEVTDVDVADAAPEGLSGFEVR